MKNKYQVPAGLITRNECRVCGRGKLEPIMSLGMQHLSNFVDEPGQAVYAAPIDLVLCNKKEGGCGLLQLRHTVPGDLLYRKFWYKSGTNQTMRDALADIVAKAKEMIKLRDGDVVLDIGANDGTLLRCYGSGKLTLAGFEPARNLVEEAQVGTTKIINDFFNHQAFAKEFGSRKARIITSVAMFYDLEDPNAFVSDIAKTLDGDGIWVIQMNYLTTMLENNAFDNIVHEHLEYYSLLSLENLLQRHGLTVFDVEQNDVNGGSIRTYVKHKACKKYPTSTRVSDTIEYERKADLESPRAYHEFADRIGRLKEEIHSFIEKQVQDGKKVYVYGASTRGNTLLQYYDLDFRLIHSAADRNPAKWGKKTAGTSIPIVSEDQARKERPDYFLILPWYFAEEFIKREQAFLKNGGKFILPLPGLRIVSG